MITSSRAFRFAVALSAFYVTGASAQAQATETLVVLNKSEHSASLIDPATGATLVKLPVGRGPHELALSPDGRTAYVANFGRFGVFPAGIRCTRSPATR